MKNRSLHRPGVLLFTLASLMLLSLSPLAAERYEGERWSFLDSKQVLEAAADITVSKYPDCDVATVDGRMVRVYRPDGTGQCQDEVYVKVLTEKGKRGNRTLRMSFTLPYFRAEVVKIEVIKPEGAVVPVDVAANSKETIDDSQMGMNIYDPNHRILQVNIPGVEVGDIIHSIRRTEVLRPIIPGEFAEYNVFAGEGYIRRLAYEIYEPSEKPLKQIILRDEVPGTIQHTIRPAGSSETLHRWEVKHVPRMFNEPNMPPHAQVLQRLMVSTTPNWEAVSKWYWDLSKPHLDATNAGMKKTVEELIAGAKTDLEKIYAVFYYVSKNIRYMGITPEKDRPGFEPHDVCLTFDNKYGVCRDKAALLVSMLNLAGLQSYPVLINVGLKVDSEVPAPYFNHAIVAVELVKGEYVLMDPTDENTKELLPSYECDQSYLVCRPEGDTIRISPVIPSEENMLQVTTIATLDTAGRLTAKSEIGFAGVNDNAYRGIFARMKSDDKRRFFESNLKRTMPGATLQILKITPEDMLDTSAPLRVEMEFTSEGMVAAGGGKAIANLPWVGKGLGVANFILGGTGLEKRKYPIQTSVACGLREDISVKLGEGFAGSISMPTPTRVEDECMTYQQQVEFRENALQGARVLKLKVVEFSPAQYLKLKDALQLMEFDGRKAPVLATLERPPTQVAAPTVESDSRVLEVRKELHVKDPHSAVYRVAYSKLILNYSGKKEEAEIKISYNPACEEARLIRASVLSKTGQRQEISKDEINIMDAGWNASAKRYTGGKILVANLPGVDIGSTIEVEFEVTSKNKPFIAGFEPFQLFNDLERKSFKLTAPSHLALRKVLPGPAGLVNEEIKKEGDRQILLWQAQNVKALPSEPSLPPDWLFLAGVGYQVGEVKPYLKELRAIFLDRASQGAKAAQMARQLADSKPKSEAVIAIRDHIAKSIRLAGPSFLELPLSELSAADTTLQDGYGHAADRAILYYAMLAAIGLEPEFVLASSLPELENITSVLRSFPLPQSFSVPLVSFELDGDIYYLNDTDQYARLGTTSFEGRLGIALSSQNSLITIKTAPEHKSRFETTYALSLADDGKTQVAIQRHYFGTDFNYRNRFFSELPPEERRRYHQQIVSWVAQGAKPVGDLVTRFDTYPGVEQFNVEIENYAVADGNFFYFDLPFGVSLLPARTDHRSLPFFISREQERTIRTEIELPPGFAQVAIAPPSEELNAPNGSGAAQISSLHYGNKWIIVHQLRTSPAVVSPISYPEMLKVESALGKRSARAFLLEKTASDQRWTGKNQ